VDDVNAQDWVEAIGARSLGQRAFTARERKSSPYGPPSEVEHFQFAFKRWDGPIRPWKEHFGKGKGQVHSLDGAEPLRSCNEVETAKRLRTVREHAFWFSGYNPTAVPDIWRLWVRSLGVEAPDWLTALDAAVRDRIRSPKGGMPDVVAWNTDEPLASAIFVECKGPNERIGESQEDWVWAVRQQGIGLPQVAVSLRPF
jgi:hypothetical protein